MTDCKQCIRWHCFIKTGGLQKIRGLAPLCQLCKETLKISYPPIIKPPPPIPGSTPFLVKILHPPHNSHFWKISSPLHEEVRRGDSNYVVVSIMSALLVSCFTCMVIILIVFGCYYYSYTIWCLIILIYILIPWYCYYFSHLHMGFY